MTRRKHEKESTVTQQLDGSIEFTIYVLNTSTVQAKNGSVFARVCESCSFAKEPERFSKPPGGHSYDRELPFAVLNAGTALAVLLSVMPPKGEHRIEVTFIYRCENCEIAPNDNLFVNF